MWIKDLWPPSYKKKAALNAYPLGDLDDPYWKDANFFAFEENGGISKIALLYSGLKIPILIAIENNSDKNLSYLLQKIKANFPNRLYAHLSPRQRETMLKYYSASSHGLHQIMELKNSGFLNQIETDNVVCVNLEELEKMLALFDLAYPGHSFERKMLDYGPYFGIKDEAGSLLRVGGVHVYSDKFSVSTQGNIATLPSARGLGLGSQMVAHLCQELAQ